MDRPLLDRVHNYTILNHWSKHFFHAFTNSFNIGSYRKTYTPISINRSISAIISANQYIGWAPQIILCPGFSPFAVATAGSRRIDCKNVGSGIRLAFVCWQTFQDKGQRILSMCFRRVRRQGIAKPFSRWLSIVKSETCYLTRSFTFLSFALSQFLRDF